MDSYLRTLGGVIIAASVAGCAAVSVHKLDRTNGKIVQDAAEGLRFYLPRPYVSVYEPFVVSSEVYLARGEVSPDSKYVLLTEVPQGLKALVNNELANGKQANKPLTIEAIQVRVIPSPIGTPQSAPAESATPAETPSQNGQTEAAPTPESGTATPPQVMPGVLNYKALNDNSAYAVTPQPRYFNILWLPDFDEQYVVTAKAGLGNANTLIGLGQGWSLQSLDATVDNSSTVKPLLDFYSNTINALQNVVAAKINRPLSLLAKPEAAPAMTAQKLAGGTPVTLKVTKVRIAAPGLYPILKPNEMTGLSASDKESKRILIPKPPLTNIAFNTYDVIVIEAASPTGDSALRIQQYVDTNSPPPSFSVESNSMNSGKQSTMGHLSSPQRKLNDELSGPKYSTKSQEYYVATLNESDGAVIVTLTKRSKGKTGDLDTLPDDHEIKTVVVKFLESIGTKVTSQNVRIKP